MQTSLNIGIECLRSTFPANSSVIECFDPLLYNTESHKVSGQCSCSDTKISHMTLT